MVTALPFFLYVYPPFSLSLHPLLQSSLPTEHDSFLVPYRQILIPWAPLSPDDCDTPDGSPFEGIQVNNFFGAVLDHGGGLVE